MTITAIAAHATDTGIVCARCSTWTTKVRHASVAAVRLCCSLPVSAAPVAPAETVVRMASLPPVPGAPVAPAAMLDEAEAAGARVLANVSPAEVAVPAGRYAVRGLDGVVKFYVVDHGREGTRWAGRIFVSVQAGDELHPVKSHATRTGILAAILVDPAGASRLYGQELGRCGVCNRTLTDPESIAAGIGPVCAGRF